MSNLISKNPLCQISATLDDIVEGAIIHVFNINQESGQELIRTCKIAGQVFEKNGALMVNCQIGNSLHEMSLSDNGIVPRNGDFLNGWNKFNFAVRDFPAEVKESFNSQS